MSQRLNNLNEIIAVLQAGEDFYRSAARQTDKPEVENVYVKHAETREEARRHLSQVVDEAGHEPAGAKPTEQAKAWVNKAATLFNDKEDTLVNGLEEHEDRTLATFRKVIEHPDNARDRAMLEEMMGAFQATHDHMRELQKAS